jgi:hypothetical protein
VHPIVSVPEQRKTGPTLGLASVNGWSIFFACHRRIKLGIRITSFQPSHGLATFRNVKVLLLKTLASRARIFGPASSGL